MEKITLIENKPIKFYDYLSTHTDLYDGLGLSESDIDFINNEFYEFEVNPVSFYREFRNNIKLYIVPYKEMKAIQFQKRIFDITTNEIVTNITNDITNESNGTNTGNSKQTNDNGARQTINKDANRTLSMASNGNNFNTIIDWGQGASGIGENHSDSKAFTDTITANDSRTLHNLGTQLSKGKTKSKAVNDQAVNLIRNIYYYIQEPKALSWLVNKLRKCFILIL